MNNNVLERLRDQEAKEKMIEHKKIELNPLIQYSTTQLKKELKRRKRQ